MSILGETNGPDAPHVFIDGERTYEVRMIDDVVMLAFERDLFARSKEAVRQTRDMLTEQEYRDRVTELSAQYEAGEFAFSAQKGRAAIQTPNGMLKLASLLFGISAGQMTKLIISRGKDVTDLITLIIRESFPAVEGENPDPK